MGATADSLPTDLAAAHAMIIATRAALLAAEARASALESEAKFRALLIEKLKYTIAKLRHEKFGQSAERSAILEQLELSLADLEEDASQAEAKAQMAAAAANGKVVVMVIERRKPARRPLPEQLPRERVVYPAPSACACCGGALHKIGEDVTETLELVPRQWKVIQHVREKFSCRSCESIAQPPAPSHPIARGRAGPDNCTSYRHWRTSGAASPSAASGHTTPLLGQGRPRWAAVLLCRSCRPRDKL
jgi:transposase